MVPTGSDPGSPALEVSDAARSTLVRALRVAFPHDSFPDGPYERTAQAVVSASEGSTWSTMSLVQGLASLDAICGGRFADLSEEDATRVLLHVEHTEFFDLLRRTAVVALYDDHEVWTLLGYEGASFDQGGYLHRGFDDLDWLPDPRIEEYDGPERLVEVAAPGQLGAGTAGTPPAASHPGRARTRAGSTGTPGRGSRSGSAAGSTTSGEGAN